MTAQGGPGLTPKEALVNLRMRAGQELDPVVVAAAVRTVPTRSSSWGRQPTARPAAISLVWADLARVRADELLEAAPGEGRQQRGQLRTLGAGVLRPPVRKRLGTSDDHFRQLLELRAGEAVADGRGSSASSSASAPVARVRKLR